MSIFFIIFGIVSFVYGILKITGIKKEDITKDSELDKKFFSKETRYFIGRYYASFGFITAGLGAISLGFILYFSH